MKNLIQEASKITAEILKGAPYTSPVLIVCYVP